MKLSFHFLLCCIVLVFCVSVQGQNSFEPLFADDLSNAIYPDGIWSFDDGILTATEDQAIWTSKVYQDFQLSLEFKTAEGTNSGVILYCSDMHNWIPNSVEVQIADDFAKEWAESPKTWQCGAVFGHLAPTMSAVKKPGEWNEMIVIARDRLVIVSINGKIVSTMNMKLWTSATENPDGSEIPAWLSKPVADLPNYGHIGLQGKHAGAPIYFRNVRINEF